MNIKSNGKSRTQPFPRRGASTAGLVCLIISLFSARPANGYFNIYLTTPLDGSAGAANSFPVIQGYTQDRDGSGCFDQFAYLKVALIREGDNHYWDGAAWVPGQVLLNTAYTAQPAVWVCTSPMPAGADLPEGRYQVWVLTGENQQQPTICNPQAFFTVDRTPPTLDIGNPRDGSVIQSFCNLTVFTTDFGGSGVDTVVFGLRRNIDFKWWTGSSWGDPTSLSADLASACGQNNLPSGTNLLDAAYIIIVSAYDRAGNVTNKATSFLIDTTPPPPPIIQVPANGATLAGLPAIGGTAQDNPGGGGLDRLDLTLVRASDGQYWSGSNWTVFVRSLTTTLSGSDWSRASGLPLGADLADGTYIVTVTALDLAGLTGTNTSTFNINAVVPTVDITSPPNLAAYTTFPGISGIARAGAGLVVTHVVVYLYQESTAAYWDGSAWDDRNTTALPTSLSGTNWSYGGQLPAGTNATDDLYALFAYAYDNAGHSSLILHYFYLDTTAPAAPTIDFPTNNASQNHFASFNGSASDNSGGSGISGVILLLSRNSDGQYWNGSGWDVFSFGSFLGATQSGSNWVRDFSLPAGDLLTEGIYTVLAYAVDRAGNISAATTISNLIDFTAPSVVFISPPVGVPQLNLGSISVNAQDNPGGSGLARVEMTIRRSSDGGYWSGTNWGNVRAALAMGLSGTNWQGASLPSGADLADDVYLLIASAYDRAGNRGRAFRSVGITNNDDFTRRIVFDGSPVSVTGSNVGASEEAGEPDPWGVPGGRSVWWSWTAPLSGGVTITTLGSSFDTMLAVYTGSTLSTLATIASNDDDPYGGLTSRVVFNAVAGTTYQIVVDGYRGAMGSIRLNLTRPVLQILVSQQSALVLWPTSELGFVLESADGLSATNMWNLVTNVPALLNGQNSINDPLSVWSRFYRLRKP
jgi:hypothetical protein